MHYSSASSGPQSDSVVSRGHARAHHTFEAKRFRRIPRTAFKKTFPRAAARPALVSWHEREPKGKMRKSVARGRRSKHPHPQFVASVPFIAASPALTRAAAAFRSGKKNFDAFLPRNTSHKRELLSSTRLLGVGNPKDVAPDSSRKIVEGTAPFGGHNGEKYTDAKTDR